MMRRIVLAVDDAGSTVAIGPVGKDESVELIREQVEAAGWENYGVVPYMSAADFRAETRDARKTRAAAMAPMPLGVYADARRSKTRRRSP